MSFLDHRNVTGCHMGRSCDVFTSFFLLLCVIPREISQLTIVTRGR